MALPVLLDFTGADNTALTTYAAGFSMVTGAASNLVIHSGRMQPNGGSDGRARWTGDAFSDDQYCIGVIALVSARTNYIEQYLRMNSGGNTFYWLYLQNTAGEFGKQVSGVNTTFLSSISYADGDVFEMRASGTTISLLKNSTQIASQTDSAIATGMPAVGGYGYSSSIEHGWTTWEASNLGAAAATSIAFKPGPRGWAGLIVR